MLCKIGCRQVIFEEFWCRKNVELYKSTKYVKILGTRNHILMQDGATEVGNADKMWPHGGQSDAQSSERSDNESRRKQKDAKRKPVEAKRVVCGAQRVPKGSQRGTKNASKNPCPKKVVNGTIARKQFSL